jgi:DNA-binding transcriptional regulator YiaG
MNEDLEQAKENKRRAMVRRLAIALATNVETLQAWLAGESRAPTEAYLKALDIVAEGERHRP